MQRIKKLLIKYYNDFSLRLNRYVMKDIDRHYLI